MERKRGWIFSSVSRSNFCKNSFLWIRSREQRDWTRSSGRVWTRWPWPCPNKTEEHTETSRGRVIKRVTLLTLSQDPLPPFHPRTFHLLLFSVHTFLLLPKLIPLDISSPISRSSESFMFLADNYRLYQTWNEVSPFLLLTALLQAQPEFITRGWTGPPLNLQLGTYLSGTLIKPSYPNRSLSRSLPRDTGPACLPPRYSSVTQPETGRWIQADIIDTEPRPRLTFLW